MQLRILNFPDAMKLGHIIVDTLRKCPLSVEEIVETLPPSEIVKVGDILGIQIIPDKGKQLVNATILQMEANRILDICVVVSRLYKEANLL